MSISLSPIILFLVLPLISLLSLFAGRKSHLAITNLSGGKNRAERAAEYSDKAAGQLHSTRRTQASCAVAVCAPVLDVVRSIRCANGMKIMMRIKTSQHKSLDFLSR